MTTSGRRCEGCGSPLPETPAGTRQITCAFCGLVNDLLHPTPSAQPVTIQVDLGNAGRSAGNAVRTLAWLVFAGIALTMAVVAFAVYSAMRPVTEAMKGVSDQISQVSRAVPRASRMQKIAPANLAAAGETGWHELDVVPPSSGWAAFEPVTDLQWAMKIAHDWTPEARLTRIDVNRLKGEGTIDLTAGPDNSAGYRFVAPSQVEGWKAIADRDSNAKVPYELMIKLAEQKVTALIVHGRPPTDELPPLDVVSQPAPELLGLAAKDKSFAPHPFYNGYMIHLEREGWVWYLSSLSGQSSLPRVRARDGAVYPYQTKRKS